MNILKKQGFFKNFPLGNKKGVNFVVMVLVIWLIIVVFGLVFYFGSSGKEKASEEKLSPPKETLPTRELSIGDLKLCYNIDESFGCEENVDGVFKIGSSFYIYFVINNLKAEKIGDNYQFGFIETRTLFDTKRDVISGEEEVVVLDIIEDVSSEGYYQRYVKNEIISGLSDEEGFYEAEIKVKDKFTGKEIIKKIKFGLGK